MRKSLLIVVAIAAVLGVQFGDCLSAITQDQQSMRCCGSMPCDPSNHSHDCCKGMVSAQSPSVLPVAHVTLHPPMMVVADVLASPEATLHSEISRLDFEAPQHSPPELNAEEPRNPSEKFRSGASPRAMPEHLRRPSSVDAE